MNTRNTLLALSTALTLGLLGTSLAQADADHGGSGEGRAFHVGPTGQILGTVRCGTRTSTTVGRRLQVGQRMAMRRIIRRTSTTAFGERLLALGYRQGPWVRAQGPLRGSSIVVNYSAAANKLLRFPIIISARL
jgi:hypothetical protein